ncbi:hypothetical protein K435DRAFT_450087 [Dendrothele bispora CBS 962.96]|uniref:FAD-binding PCMH-type domain-containing protein n=1 Tax=Dendrothele bispora (strain CBS 962.96) TaxID=1314807 RepID=A0A4S8MUK0_DENBC|nr:hypothetical protein K435DRAFT_450087 [Dendrothele bispora CBS 962.96]
MALVSEEQFKELRDAIRGKIYGRDDPSFEEHTLMFNGNVQTLAQIVSCPLDAQDVSQIILFCRKHSFSPSVKAGGFGTAGWAVGGDVVIDLSALTGVEIEEPGENNSYTSLRDMVPPNNKGKKSVSQSLPPPASLVTGVDTDGQPANNSPTIPSSSSQKRRREEDPALLYDSASRNVNTFLHPHLSRHDSDLPSPSIRRRLDDENAPEQASFTSSDSFPFPANGSDQNDGHIITSNDQNDLVINNTDNIVTTSIERSDSSGDSSLSSGANSSTASSSSTPASSVPPGPSYSSNSGAPFNADPFGYINVPSSSAGATLRSSFNSTSRSVYPHWGSGSGSSPLISNSNHHILSAQAQPLYTHAYVTFGAGMKQKEVDIYTANHPLEARSLTGGDDSIPYHVPFAAHPVGSSVMLLGGFGFLGRLHGLSIDNLVEVEMVLADGKIIIVNENEYSDLWWALRGAGPTFGVVTRYKAKAYPVPVVYAGNLIYRFHRATAPSLIKHFRDCIKGAPRELYANVLLTAGPANKDSLIVIQMCYVGPQEKGQEFLAAISSWDGEKCLLNEVNEKSFLHQQDSVAQVLRGKAGRQWFIRSALITSLPDEVINQTVMQFDNTPEGCTWLFELAGGAIADYENTCVPKSQREALFTVAALHQWDMGLDDVRCITTAESWIKETLKPVQTGGPFPSFLGRHEPPSRVISCFGHNWERMKEIKKDYDPTNVFRNSLWPLNQDGEEVDASTHEPPMPEGSNNIPNALALGEASGV